MITLFFLEFLVLKALFYVFILALVALFVFVCVGGACAKIGRASCRERVSG